MNQAHTAAAEHRLQPCRLCGRVPKKGTTEHHLIPRRCHKNKWFKKRYNREEMNRTIPVCWDCHRTIHRAVPSEKELGRNYSTVDQILAHDEIGRFVRWVAKRR